MAVYFIRAECGRVKIGWTTEPSATSRLRDMQTGSPELLEIAAVWRSGTSGDEMLLHREFSHHRVHGEWFAPCERLADLIAHVKCVGTIDGFPLRSDRVPEDIGEAASKLAWNAPLSPDEPECGPATVEGELWANLLFDWRSENSLIGMPPDDDGLVEHHSIRSPVWMNLFGNTEFNSNGSRTAAQAIFEAVRKRRNTEWVAALWVHTFVCQIARDIQRHGHWDVRNRYMSHVGPLLGCLERFSELPSWHHLAASIVPISMEPSQFPGWVSLSQFVRLCAKTRASIYGCWEIVEEQR